MGRRRYGETGPADAFNATSAEYRAAKATRFRRALTGVASGGSNADWHYRNEADYFRMIEMARMADRDNRVVGQGVTRAVNLVFKSGLKFDSNTGDTVLDADIKARWKAWSENPAACDAKGKCSFDDLAKMVFRHVLVDGDHVVLPLKEGWLQCVEAHRLVTPRNVRNATRKRKVVHGVELGKAGRPLNYWITKENADPYRVERVSDVRKYAAFDEQGNPQVFHCFKPDRVSQTRGVTVFARMIEDAEAHDDLQFSTLIKAQVSACFAIFREMAEPSAPPSSGAMSAGAQSTETLADGSIRFLDHIAPGMDITGRPGEKLQGFSPNVPNTSFFEHAYLILTFIAINLNIPLMVLLLDPRQTNFSGWRGAMDMAKVGFQDVRSWMGTQFHTPVYRWWLQNEMAKDPALRSAAAKTGINVFGHQFKAPYDGYIEPFKDVQADRVLVESGLDSRRNVLARRGLDLEEVDEARVADAAMWIARCQEAAKNLGETLGVEVDWRTVSEAASLVPLPMGGAPSAEV